MSSRWPRILTHLPPELLDPVRRACPGIEILCVPPRGEIEPGIEGDVLLTWAWKGAENLAPLVRRGVQWVHAVGAGMDGFPFEAVGDRPLTCSRGASAIPIAEWALAMMLAFEKRVPECWIASPPERWHAAELGTLAGKTLGLVGLGGIGTAVARRALGFDMRVRAIRRTSRPSPLAEVEIAGSLGGLVRGADHLVIAAAATAASRHLIGREALSQVKPGVHLVNVARGSLLDQEALREALDAGRVARASLDVCEPEPLPAGHWLYAHPRVRLSPHISWRTPGAHLQLLDAFLENLGRWVRGEPLGNLVDVDAGY